MKITTVDAIHLRLPQVAEIADGTQDVLLVRVATDEGLVGWGEVASAPTVAKAAIEAPRSAARRHGLAAVLIGTDTLDPPARWQEMYDASRWYGRRGVAIHAMSGIDLALWDIVGKAAGQPVSALWGAKRDRVRAYASTLFPDTPKEAAALTRDFIEHGFGAVKFGWGSFGRDPDHDRALLDAICEAGDGVELMVDAGLAWTANQAVERARDLFTRYPITWLEEPLQEDDLDGYALLARSVNGRIAAGESDSTVYPFRTLLNCGVSVLQPDVCRAGGLTACRQIEALAQERDAWCIPHCFSTGINLAASLQWMGAAFAAPFAEYPVRSSPLRNRLVHHGPVALDGWVAVPQGPGLGVEVDEAVVNEFRVA